MIQLRSAIVVMLFSSLFSGSNQAQAQAKAVPASHSENVLNLQIHFGEHLLHGLDLQGGVADQFLAVAHEIAQRDDVLCGAK